MSSIPARSLTFVEIDHEIFTTVILLISLIQEGLLSVTSESIACPGKSVVRLTDSLDITIAVDRDLKSLTKQNYWTYGTCAKILNIFLFFEIKSWL